MAHVLTINGRTPRISAEAFVAPDATVAGDVIVEPGVGIWFGGVVRSEREEVRIGARSNLQDHVIVHADPGFPTRIGERVTVGHRAVLHGCSVGDDALIGMGAIILNGARIGEGAVVGAGAVVREGMEVPAWSLAVGVPAKIREAPVPAAPRANVAIYAELAAWYAAALDGDPEH